MNNNYEIPRIWHKRIVRKLCHSEQFNNRKHFCDPWRCSHIICIRPRSIVVLVNSLRYYKVLFCIVYLSFYLKKKKYFILIIIKKLKISFQPSYTGYLIDIRKYRSITTTKFAQISNCAWSSAYCAHCFSDID